MIVKSKIVLFNGPPSGFITSNLSSRRDPSTFEVKAFHNLPLDESAFKAIKEANLFVAFPGNIFLDEKILEVAQNVELIQFLSVGYDNIDLDAASRLSIPVVNNPGWPAVSVAEHTIILILMALKQDIVVYTKTVQNISDGEFSHPTSYEYKGKTLGLLGFGSIGREVARLSSVFGVKILYHKRTRLPEREEKSLGVEYVSFEDLLARSDVLSIHTPLKEKTRGLISVNELAKMKKSAVIVNTARKEIVDENALFEALSQGRLFGFGTDFVPDHPLSGLENVSMTPHVAVTPEAMVRMSTQGFDNISRQLNGKKPKYIVNDVG